MKRKNLSLYGVVTLFILIFYLSFFNLNIYGTEIENKGISKNNIANTTISTPTISDIKLFCNSNIALDYDSGNILYSNNSDKKIYPASTTKILTCILAIENLKLTDTTVVSKNAVNSTPYGSSIMGVKKEELYTIEELLYGLMLPSGNDAALVLAEAVSNTTNEFVKLMNEKAKNLGCKNTHFTNPHGFHDENHYTTAQDMAIIFKYCLENETFRKIIGTTKKTVKAANSETEIVLVNTNKMQNPNYTKIYYEYMKGGKTGYTDEARGTFIGYGKKDDKTVIIASFDGSQNINGYQARFLDSKTLLEFCFENYSKQLIFKADDYVFNAYDDKNGKCYSVKPEKDFYALVNTTPNSQYSITIDYESLEKELLENKNITGNDSIINQNIKAGEIIVTYDLNNKISNSNSKFTHTQGLILTNVSDYMTKKEINNIIYSTIMLFLILLFIILILIILKNNKNKKDNDMYYMDNLKNKKIRKFKTINSKVNNKNTNKIKNKIKKSKELKKNKKVKVKFKPQYKVKPNYTFYK